MNTNSDFNFEQNINQIESVNVNDNVIEYLDNISEYIKRNYNNSHISPRCLKQTLGLAKSLSFINSKKYVTYQEIKDVLPFVLRHRLNIVEKKNFLIL